MDSDSDVTLHLHYDRLQRHENDHLYFLLLPDVSPYFGIMGSSGFGAFVCGSVGVHLL